ncbi:hypothetical protein [Bradyrhizobium liaoningense]|nr:hypothetical protein [Bradyrhizobium liaoningense]MBR0716640.1 hypothetical protein [Bradyrhizobium liaoningense]
MTTLAQVLGHVLARIERPIKRMLDVLTIKLLKATAAKCRGYRYHPVA